MFESLFEALQMSFMQRALAATLAMSLLCPVMGLFLVLRRSSMTGDALSHSSLAGAAAALALGVNPVVGTFVFTAVCGLMIEALRSVFRHYGDLVLTIVQALSVGIALTLITMGLVKGNAESFLFGSILTISQTDLWCILAITAAALLWVGFGLSTLTVIAFDEDSARAAGVKTRRWSYAFSLLTASAVAAAIPMVGVLVLSSMIALPAATALQLKVGFKRTLIAAIVISIIDAFLGLIFAYLLDAAPGGVTALASVAVLLLVPFADSAMIARRPLLSRRAPKLYDSAQRPLSIFRGGELKMPRSTRYTTRQRAAVLACLKERTGQYLGVQDVADAVKKLGVSVGLTTIYRNLDTLVEEGAVRKFVVDKNSAAVYEYLDDPHTEEFHVKCRACGTLFHLRCSEIERMAAALSGHLLEDHGVELDFQSSVIQGLCKDCRAKADAAKTAAANQTIEND